MVFLSEVTIQPLPGEPDQVFLSRRLYESWNIAACPYLTLKCGQNRQQIHCVPAIHDNEAKLTCDPRLFQAFHLPEEPLPLRLAFDPQTEELEIGPVIAVLTFLKKNTFEGPLMPYCEEMARYCVKHHALFYVFTLRDWRQDSVIGYMWQHNHWNRRELPKPHVIHNRIGQRKLEQSQATKQFFENLAEKQIAIFNTRFLDKWEVHEKLSAHRELLPYLPKTVLYEEKASLQAMVKRYVYVFLKPASGSRGERIFRIHREENYFELDYTTFSNDSRRQFSTFDELYMVLVSRLRRQRYIIQQGLSLIEYNRRPLDFRMLVNKGQTGTWNITSGVARVSSEEQFVSNLARGGASFSVQEVLKNTFDKNHAVQIRKLLGELALETAETISFETEGLYGEFGIDLALDQHGKPWIIEVNTKPSKDLDPDRKQSVIRPSAKAVIDYGCYLADFVKI